MAIKSASPGSVSWGTMRTQDLIPKFLDVLRQLDSPYYEAFVSSPFPRIPEDAWDDENHSWWESEEAHYLLDELFDALDAHAPDGHYFGSHPGDGCDYGFWEVEEL